MNSIDYIYQKTKAIEKYLQDIEVAKRVIDLMPQKPHIEENLRRKSMLKSALYSARIEGNRLRLEDIEHLTPSEQKKSRIKKEVFNIISGLHWILLGKHCINLKTILKLHSFVMAGISPEGGFLRTEHSAIFNQAGVAVYMTSPPNEIKNSLIKLINYINKSKEHVLIKSAMAHLAFEKIHPFIDGNGRVGRLLSVLILNNSGYGFRGMVHQEEYIEGNRDDYYYYLSSNKREITGFVEFILKALSSQAEKAIESLKKTKDEKPENILLSRRREMLDIIKDHREVSYDFLRRRFLAISESTLHYDLKCLTRDNYIIKRGSTRGAVYAVREI